MDADAANSAGRPAGEGGHDRAKAPGIDEALRDLNAARRETVAGARSTASALRELAAADFALARGALGRSLAWAGVAALLGSSAWLLLTVVLVAALNALGLDWVWALLLVAVAYLAAAGFCVWRMRGYLEHMDMRATRRQLSRLRHKGEAAADAGTAPPAPAAAAAQGVE
ncbi:phage holin family protein [Luteimonas sp. SDU82]|uniref:phage holin family protein n=1 Tax=Luteimonas sp. SDU82 TaxID=3422592 RepID=UPI003EBA8FD5